MQTTKHGAKGEMDLSYHNEESGSSHREQTRHIKLKAIDEETIALAIEVSDHNACNGSCDTTGTEHYKISVADLVKLIRDHGKSYRPPRPIPVEVVPQKPRRKLPR